MKREREHVVVHLHPKTVRRIRMLMEKQHYSTVEEFIIDATAARIRENRRH